MSHFCELHQDDRGVATVRIVNSGSLAILGTPVMNDLIGSISALDSDKDVRVVVLTGTDKAFIGGADLKEMSNLGPDTARVFIRRLAAVCEAVRRCRAPVIARIQGWCLGGGLEVAAACDFCIAAETAHFGMPEVRVGIPSVIHAALLSRSMGRRRANWLMMTADYIDARQALDWGLIDRVAATGSLDTEVESAIGSLLLSDPHVLRDQKALLNTWDELTLSQGIEASVDVFGHAFDDGTPNRLMKAFLEKHAGTH